MEYIPQQRKLLKQKQIGGNGLSLCAQMVFLRKEITWLEEISDVSLKQHGTMGACVPRPRKVSSPPPTPVLVEEMGKILANLPTFQTFQNLHLQNVCFC